MISLFERSKLTYRKCMVIQVLSKFHFLIVLNGESKENSSAWHTLDLSVLAKTMPFHIDSIVVLSNWIFTMHIHVYSSMYRYIVCNI